MRPRNTLLLLLILLTLGAYVYWVELPREARESAEKKLVTLDRDAVTGITLEYPDRSITLEKSPEGRWRIVKPVAADADDAAVKNLIGAIADAEVTRTLEDVGDKLASYGLDTPEATVRITRKDGTALPAIKVGKTTAIGFSAYAQKGDDPKVYVTGGALQSGVKKQLKDLRDKTIITFEDQGVQQLELARGSEAPIVLDRVDADRWRITAPASYPADSPEVRSLLASLRGIRADDFVSEDPAADLKQYGLAPPRLKATVWLGKDRAQKTLLIGNARDEKDKPVLFAKRAEGPTVYSIPEYSFKNLDKNLATLRDKTVLSFEKDKAAKIEVARKDGLGFTLRKRDGAWHIETPGEGTERAPTLLRYAEDVATMKGSEIVAEHATDLSQYGLASPDITIFISDETGRPLATMIGARGGMTGPDAKSYLAAAGSDIVYGVKSFSYDRIDKKASDFRDLPPSPTPTGAGVATPLAPDAEDLEGAAGDGLDFGDEDLDGEADDLGD